MPEKTWLSSNSTFESPSLFKKLSGFVDYLLHGKGYDSYIHEASWWKFLLRKPIPYKIICKVAQLRSAKYIENPKTYQTSDTDISRVIDYTVRQNKLNKVYGSARRMQPYYHLSEVFQVKPLSECNLLVVGPKFVVELLLAWTYGFKWKNIDAIDLIQCHPKIRLANVDNFSSQNEYDVIVMANVFGYNSDPDGCLDCLSSALKKDGILVFNSAYIRNHAQLPDPPLSSCLTSFDIKDRMSQRGLRVLSEVTREKEAAVSTLWVAKLS